MTKPTNDYVKSRLFVIGVVFIVYYFFNVARESFWYVSRIVWIPRLNSTMIIRICVLTFAVLIMSKKLGNPHGFFMKYQTTFHTTIVQSIGLVLASCVFAIIFGRPQNIKELMDIQLYAHWRLYHLIFYSLIFYLTYFTIKNAYSFPTTIHLSVLTLLTVSSMWKLPLLIVELSEEIVQGYFVGDALGLVVDIMANMFGFVATAFLIVYMKQHKLSIRKTLFVPYVLLLTFYFLNYFYVIQISVPLLTQVMRVSMAIPFIIALRGSKQT